jgi:hypothetical protein
MGQQNHKTVTYPAPIRGLNVSDSLVAMEPTYATVLRNFWAQPYGLEIRKGNVRHATGLPAAVETIFNHISAIGTNARKIYCLSLTSMYDVTNPGNQARTPVVTGLTNARWENVAISNASGYNTILTNGVDNPIRVHDNSTITRLTIAVNPSLPGADEIAGVDPKKFTMGTLHQKRLWFVERDSTKAWYLAPEALSGQAYQFDFGAVFTMGGKLMALASWTLDSGIGPDDKLIAISTLGEIAIYSGSDPSSITTFALQGVFYTGDPITPRGICKVAGDLLILTQFGLLSMNAAMATSDTAQSQGSQYLSEKIQYLLSTLAARLPNTFGWDLVNWPSNNMILINVPLYTGMGMETAQFAESRSSTSGNSSGQLVQSTITKGWAQWDNFDAMCWTAFSETMMYGDDVGNVWRYEGNTDGAIQVDAGNITPGLSINAECQTAFNFLGHQSTVKHAKMVRPTFVNVARVPYAIKVNPDFDYVSATAPGATAINIESLWGSGIWGTSKWKGSMQTQKLWTAVSGIGAAFAVRLALNTSEPVLWAAYDLMYEDGRNI